MESRKLTRKVFLQAGGAFAAVPWARLFAAADGKPGRLPDGWVAGVYRDEADYLVRKFRQDVTDPATGLGNEALKKGAMALAKELEGKIPWPVAKAKLFAYVCDSMSIGVNELDWFPAFTMWSRWDRTLEPVMRMRKDHVNAKYCPDVTAEIQAGNRSGKWTVWQDFDHSVPDWDVILPLGFTGMKARMLKYRRDTPRFDGMEITIDAILRTIGRYVDYAKARLEREGGGWTAHRRERIVKEIASLEQMRTGAPRTAYETMQFIFLYWIFCEQIDRMQVRSLSNLDRILTPYYDADLAAGRTTEAEFREQFRHFLWQWGSMDNYWGQPAYLGGTRKDGSTEYNHVSKIILDIIDSENLPTPKFQLKIADNTPQWVLDKTLDMARRHRSLVFCGEKGMTRAMKHYGATDEQCRTMIMQGCYEFAIRDSSNGTGVGHINMLQPVTTLLAEAKDGKFAAATWPEFKAAYLARMTGIVDRSRELAFEAEKHLEEINPANMFTLATEYALKTGRDAFANGTEFCNASCIMQVGLGTTVDALLAVKEIVYEKKEMGLAALGRVMADDWKGHEPLRLRMLRSKRKWGNNDPEANALGDELIKAYAGRLNGRPNSRGGIFVASGHCAKQFVVQGRKTGATPDGRKAGEEMSKNLSPTMGMDTEGVTALLNTLATLDSRDMPGDFPLDVMLLPYTVSGDAGLAAMRTILGIYFANNGLAIHFNVFDAEEYRDAQKHPEKYENLQVRVCGWNVRWNDLPKVEQDKYLARADAMAF